MDKELIVKQTINFVKNKLKQEGSGHDWYHIERVYNMSKYILKHENADDFVVEMTSLLHDIDDWKFSDDNKANTDTVEIFLKSVGVSNEYISKIINIIKTMSYKGGIVDSTQETIEGMIVQDADRLDAIGAIGIARTFTYGGYKNNLIYDPNIKPIDFTSLDEVKNKENTTINHFYEKLLKLKDLMNTRTAQKIAQKRHEFMVNFLNEFYYEWDFK